MKKKRFVKLLMGRYRFSRNLARTLAGSVQVRQKFAEKLNHIAKNRYKQLREPQRGYEWNWQHNIICEETGAIYKHHDDGYCPHCRKITPLISRYTEHTYSNGRLEFTYVDCVIYCYKCGEPLYISAIDYENPELRIEEIRNRLRRRKICEKL